MATAETAEGRPGQDGLHDITSPAATIPVCADILQQARADPTSPAALIGDFAGREHAAFEAGCRRVYREGFAAGTEHGYLRCAAELKAVNRQLAEAFKFTGRRYTYSTPALTAEEILRRARASWEGI